MPPDRHAVGYERDAALLSVILARLGASDGEDGFVVVCAVGGGCR